MFTAIKDYFYRERKLTLILVSLLTALFLFFLFFSIPKFSLIKSGKEFFVRIKLTDNSSFVKISSKGAMSVYDDIAAKPVKLTKRDTRGFTLSAVDTGIKIDNNDLATRLLRVIPSRKGYLFLNDVPYRGEFYILNKANRLLVINKIDIEDYLKGVVPSEVSHFWPFASLKAQAIACRSFAIGKALEREYMSYDMTGDTFSQAYGGVKAEKWRTTRAVQKTRGLVLTYNDKVLTSYYHSSCGGHTENIRNVWESVDIYPLGGVKCEWCRWAPHFRWQAKLAAKTIAENFNRLGYKVGRIDAIEPGKRDASGRIEYVRIKDGLRWYEIKAWEFANIMGRRNIRSSNFRVKKYPQFYYFSGYGWGHGVGMCQWGSFGLGLRWRSAEKILNFYYPGAEIQDFWKM